MARMNQTKTCQTTLSALIINFKNLQQHFSKLLLGLELSFEFNSQTSA